MKTQRAKNGTVMFVFIFNLVAFTQNLSPLEKNRPLKFSTYVKLHISNGLELTHMRSKAFGFGLTYVLNDPQNRCDLYCYSKFFAIQYRGIWCDAEFQMQLFGPFWACSCQYHILIGFKSIKHERPQFDRIQYVVTWKGTSISQLWIVWSSVTARLTQSTPTLAFKYLRNFQTGRRLWSRGRLE